MADGKKSVLLYCDIIHTVEKLDNETAGQLFKHYLRYINDDDPITDNLLVEVTFEPIKQNLKRDLVKWEIRAERSRSNGAKGGRPVNPEQPSGLSRLQEKPKEPVTVKVKVKDTVTVTGNVKVKDIKKEADLIYPFNSADFISAWSLWIRYKQDQFKFSYKSNITQQIALKELTELSDNTESIALKIIQQAIANGWKGFYKIKTDGKQGTVVKDAGNHLAQNDPDWNKY